MYEEKARQAAKSNDDPERWLFWVLSSYKGHSNIHPEESTDQIEWQNAHCHDRQDFHYLVQMIIVVSKCIINYIPIWVIAQTHYSLWTLHYDLTILQSALQEFYQQLF